MPDKPTGPAASSREGASRVTAFETLVLFSGAERDAARDPRDLTLVGRCPVCDHAKSLLIVPDSDGTAQVWCVMNNGACTASAIADRCSIPLDALTVVEGSSLFEIAHDVSVPLTRTVLGVEVLDRAALATLPEPEPLVADTIDRRTVSLLAGPPGSGKSFVALGWAASIATGTPWLGRPVEKGRVLYVVGEGAHGLAARLSAWEEHHGVTIPTESFLVLPAAVQVSKPDDLNLLVRFVERESFDLVVFDTLARMAVGVDENSAQGMGVLVQAFEDVKRATGSGTVLLVHHTGKDGETVRGSSSLEGAMDTVYRIDAAHEPSVLRRTKRKDGPVEDETHFLLDNVAESCVVVPTVRRAFVLYESPEAWHSGWIAVRLTYRDGVTFTKSEAVRAMVARGIARATAYRYLTELVASGVVRNLTRSEQAPAVYKVQDNVARRLGIPIPKPFALVSGEGTAPDLAEVVSPLSHEV